MNKPPLLSPIQSVIYGNTPIVSMDWRAWFDRAWTLLNSLDTSGPTETRPTTNLYIGKYYFDTTIGCPIWLKRVSPSVLWVDGAGAPV